MNKFPMNIKIPGIVCLLFTYLHVNAQQDRYFTPYGGLSNTTFYSIVQDNDGFLWFATNYGLNKFDGNNFTVYQHNPLDTNSLNSDMVLSAFVDASGKLWVGTNTGLQYYNKKFDNFTRCRVLFKNRNFPVEVNSITEDKTGNLWLITSHGIIKIIKATGEAVFLNNVLQDSITLARDVMNTALIDDDGMIWIGSDKNGLIYLNPYTNEIINYRYNQNQQSVCDNSILALGKDDNGNVIIGTVKGGISVFSKHTNTFRTIPYYNYPDNKFNGGVYSIIADKKGTIWIGTERNGLKALDLETYKLSDANDNINLENVKDSKIHCFCDKQENLWFAIDYAGIYLKRDKPKQFYSIRKKTGTPVGISNNIVKAILLDDEKNLWIGTDGGGLNFIPLNSNKVKVFTHNPNGNNSIPDNAVISLFEDSLKNIWIGTYLGGLSLFDKKKESFKTFLIDPQRKGRDYNYVVSIISDNRGNLWVATNGGGLQLFNIQKQEFTSYRTVYIDENNINLPAFLTTLFLDREGGLWIGSYNGLYYWNKDKSLYKSFTVGDGSLKGDIINYVTEDTKGIIWVGTSKGLYSINKNTFEIKVYTIENGLSNNTIFGILEDNKKNIWVSTLNGICKFNQTYNTFRNYNTYDGLAGNEFRPASCYKAGNSMLYFGSTSGLVYFHPDSIHDMTNFPNVVFTNFKILNNIVPIGKMPDGRTILDYSIDETKKINILYSDHSFTIEFTAIDYIAPEKIKYAFYLEGFDQKWIYKDYNQRFASYTNLYPGTYKFKLKSTNSDGIWNEKYREITFIIHPPFWKSWWAFAIYIGLIIILFITIRKMFLFRITMRHNLQMERLEREKLEELNQSKMQFFSNVSHEFRTPLTLILGPVERLLYSPIDKALKKQIGFIHRNAVRLLRLVNLLLDLQKVEKNEMHLQPQLGDIVGFTKEITDNFSELANHKKITLTFTTGIDKLEVWFDPDKLDKVLFNLLSNAFKFTTKGGSINVNLAVSKDETNTDTQKDYITISVSDTGKGIREEHLQKIFDRFYQVENQESNEMQIGTGIGLHLTKYLVELHKGKIEVTSKENEGTRFDIFLPLNIEIPADAHMVSSSEIIVPEHGNLADLEPDDTFEKDDKIISRKKPDNKVYKILIVEDDFEVRNYIKSELAEEYEILEAIDGREGWDIARENHPDLIISDVMMPRMDGIQLCKNIKSDINTSHIPIILLTAKTSIENRIEGLETGADSYIPKPFHPQHLKVRVEKLIKLRQNLINKFSKSISFEAKEVTLTSADEKFLQKAMNLVKENISNTDLNIEDMSSELGMSRVHLYRKLKSLTDQTPSEFVRTIRLKQAAYLLTQNKINIFEVAFAVGFSSHQYFTNCFQNYFNMSPSEYGKRNFKTKNTDTDSNSNDN